MGEETARISSPSRGLAAAAGALPLSLVRPEQPGAVLSGPVLSGTDVLPVLPALSGLLTSGGLQRGQVVTAGGWGLLCLALAAGASAAGAWCAAVGLPAAGVRAAADLGVEPGRLLLVAEPGPGWPQVVASLLDGCDIILLRPPDRPPAQLRRKLEATARRHGSVLLVAGEWEGAAARLHVARQEWAGLGAGHGRLRARQAQVVAEGRGAGARPRSAWVWLPGPDGAVAAVSGQPSRQRDGQEPAGPDVRAGLAEGDVLAEHDVLAEPDVLAGAG
ncbi:MAG TPA: hypothetical protein VGG35_15875 [Streptosporangiaceae bacterium]|jgi:hypothetical protein